MRSPPSWCGCTTYARSPDTPNEAARRLAKCSKGANARALENISQLPLQPLLESLRVPAAGRLRKKTKKLPSEGSSEQFKDLLAARVQDIHME
jgi:hypothetical protein